MIPNEGILFALGNKNYAKNVPVIFGSNKDELSLWLGVNNYFSERTYPFTRLIPIPKIELNYHHFFPNSMYPEAVLYI